MKGFTASGLWTKGLTLAVSQVFLSASLVGIPSNAAAEQTAKATKVASSASILDDPARELLLALSEKEPVIEKPVKKASAKEPAKTVVKVSRKVPAKSWRDDPSIKLLKTSSAPKVAAVAAAPAEKKIEKSFESNVGLAAEKKAPAAASVVNITLPVEKAVSEEASPATPKTKAPAVRAATHESENLRRELTGSLSRIEELERELDEARSQLVVAETEVNRLSSIVDARNRASLGKFQVKPLRAPSRPAPTRSVANTKPAADVAPPGAHSNLKVATISVDKADLRLGPGKNHSALMAIPRGSRLVVEARQGEWYRVFAPNGERAWVNAALVTFGDGASTLNDGSSVRVRGFDSNIEEEAFRRVQRISTTQ